MGGATAFCSHARPRLQRCRALEGRARPFEGCGRQQPRQRRVTLAAGPPGKGAAALPARRQASGASAGGRFAARFLSWRSSTQAQTAGETAEASVGSAQQQQVTAEEQQQAADVERALAEARQEAAAAAAASSGAFSLYSWLSWGSGAAPSSSSSRDDDAMDLGDGMAAAEPGSLTGTGSSSSGGGSSWRRRSWRSLTRATRSASFDDSDALAAPAVIPVDHAALQLLRQRALSGSLPGARRDPFKLGLVVEGGGMRGCVSGGALQVWRRALGWGRGSILCIGRLLVWCCLQGRFAHRLRLSISVTPAPPCNLHPSPLPLLRLVLPRQALNDLGLRNAFDAVYGSSAGAINATYFLSGERWAAVCRPAARGSCNWRRGRRFCWRVAAPLHRPNSMPLVSNAPPPLSHPPLSSPAFSRPRLQASGTAWRFTTTTSPRPSSST